MEENIEPEPAVVLPEPPVSLLEGASLFLDLDGTLLEIADRPDEVVAGKDVRVLVQRLARLLDGRLAVVSGRSLAQIDAILGMEITNSIALSGSHGSEHRWQGVDAHPVRPTALDRVADYFHAFAEGRDGVLVEVKSFGVALHYRLAPDVGEAAHGLAADLAERYQLTLQPGRKMVELRLAGGDKGTAVRRLMHRPPMAGSVPIFIGDDATDEPGFEAVRQLGGAAVLVGSRAPTAAAYALPDPAAVRAWLSAFAR